MKPRNFSDAICEAKLLLPQYDYARVLIERRQKEVVRGAKLTQT